MPYFSDDSLVLNQDDNTVKDDEYTDGDDPLIIGGDEKETDAPTKDDFADEDEEDV